MIREALLVGIDEYDHHGPLDACVNDVTSLAPLFQRHDDNSSNFNVTQITSDAVRIDRSCLMKHVKELLRPDADLAVLYFAGHGAHRSGDVVLCTQDGDEHDEGVAFSVVLGLINDSKVPEVVVMLDCCFSGGAGGHPAIGGDLSYVRSGVAILSASRRDQLAMELPIGRGSFSYFLGAALGGGAADVLGNVGISGTYAYLRESFGTGEQSPTFKCSLADLNPLRRCHPAVSPTEMRRISEFFPHDLNYLYPLDPSYEPRAEPRNATNEAIFGILQHYRAAKLVEPVGADHMYDAAMECRHCKLTPLGHHYRHLASRGML